MAAELRLQHSPSTFLPGLWAGPQIVQTRLPTVRHSQQCVPAGWADVGLAPMLHTSCSCLSLKLYNHR
jgi:hypothetical protein